jgi:CRISPR-associated protein Cas2
MVRVIVLYDISQDRTRTAVCDICKDYGLDRQQYSVFTGLLKSRQVRALVKELRHETRTGGHVLVIPVDADNWEQRMEFGQALHA